MSCTCGCCDGVRAETPVDNHNWPCQCEIRYRIGNHGQFRETMLARLAAQPALQGLTTRDPSDPSIALLDGFALIGDVLTFYQERIANEGFLRTATEPFSLVELGKLVGYRARPALASSTYLAFTLDPGASTQIPSGTGARSVPRQDELPQTFETSDDLAARYEWNNLRPAMTNAVSVTDYGDVTENSDDVRTIASIAVKGTAANVNVGDRLLFLFSSPPTAVVRVVSGSTVDFEAGKTVFSLAGQQTSLHHARSALAAAVSRARKLAPGDAVATLDSRYLEPLEARMQSRSPLTADQIFVNVLGASAGVPLPDLLDRLSEAAALAAVHQPRAVVHWYDTELRAVREAGRHLLRVAESLSGRAPAELIASRAAVREILCPPAISRASADAECDAGAGLAGLTVVLSSLRRSPSRPPHKARDAAAATTELYRPDSDVNTRLLAAADPALAPNLRLAMAAQPPTPSALSGLEVFRIKARAATGSDGAVVTLDTVYDGIIEGSWVSIGGEQRRVRSVRRSSRQETVGGSAIDIPCTVITLSAAAAAPAGEAVYAQGDELTPVGDPITDDVAGDEIELDRVYDGLSPGRLVVIAGERSDVPFTAGITAAEVAMIGGVRHRVDPDNRGTPARTVLQLTAELSYRYRRDTVTVHGNVVAATQGATRSEVLGSGNASVPNQAFRLRQVNAQNPLTALPANTPDGADDQLDVTVSGVRWQPTETLADATATDHVYGTAGTGEHSVEILFGDGVHGARPQTGAENITATFRVGAGPSGNVVAAQISQLASQPLGVGAVTNPVAATGGADGDTPPDMRASTPLRMLALDRLLSVRDYTDFTRARAGIGKADARKLSDGDRQVVHVTVAGTGDTPIDPTSEMYTALEDALTEFGDPGMPVVVDARELILLVLRAGIKVAPQYSWDIVEPAARAALSDTFSFQRRDLGQDAYLGEAVSAIQAVPGVDYVDVDVFHGIPAASSPVDLVTLGKRLTSPRRVVRARRAEFIADRVEATAGDTMTRLAFRAGLSVDELCRLNPTLADPDIAEGTALVVRRGIRPAQIALMSGIAETLMLWRIR